MAESGPAGQAEGQEEMHRQWERGQVSWEEYWDTVRLCRDGVRKAKMQMELNLAGDIKSNKKGLSRCVSMKRKGQSRCDTIGRLVRTDEKVEAASLSISLEWMNHRTQLGTGGAKFLSL